MTPVAIEDALRRMGEGADGAIDLAEAALLCAAHERDVDLDSSRQHLDEIAGEMKRAAALDGLKPGDDKLEACCDALRYVLVEKLGYRGDEETYDDLRNADLAAVIQRRRGLPVALSILYIHAARSLGWRIEGLNFPGHFVIRIHGDRQAVGDALESIHLFRRAAQIRQHIAQLSRALVFLGGGGFLHILFIEFNMGGL